MSWYQIVCYECEKVVGYSKEKQSQCVICLECDTKWRLEDDMSTEMMAAAQDEEPG